MLLLMMDLYGEKMKKKLKLLIYILLFFIVPGFIQSCQAYKTASIAFLSRQSNQEPFHIFLMDADGANRIQLQTGLFEDGCPVWSPDGKKILFVSSNGIGGDIDREAALFVVNKDGSGLKQLTREKKVIFSAASWSPDGSRIVYSAQESNFIHIYIMNSDGSDAIPLTNGTSMNVNPRWSSDGKRIIISSNLSQGRYENPYYNLFMMDADGSNLVQLTDEKAKNFAPIWSPDGKQIAFFSTPEVLVDGEGPMFWNNANIYVMDNHGLNRKQITGSPEPVLNINPDWSPDGSRIVFSSNRDHLDRPEMLFDIYVMNVDGTGTIRITTSGNDRCPAWQPQP